MSKDKKNLFIVANRLPITAERLDGRSKFKVKISSGGLVSGLMEVFNQSNCHWIGHCGIFKNDPNFSYLEKQLASQRLLPVPLEEKTYNSYYNDMCNGSIWPLFHYFPNIAQASQDGWENYKKINDQFAQYILLHAKTGDRVWVQDYQLMLLPQLLRTRLPQLSVAYFHHIPFPSSEIFRILPHRAQILSGILGADYVGFHSYEYVRHFLSSVTRVLGLELRMDELRMGNRFIKVGAHPLGVDAKNFRNNSRRISRKRKEQDYLQNMHNPVMLLGVDRLDYTKGIPNRFEGFAQFLRNNPQYQGMVSLVQLCVPSREKTLGYEELRTKVEQLVGHINGEFSIPGYTPIQYLYKSVSQDELITLYKAAHVALVTPLRDGLNLVCKEYVASRIDGDGVLILSEFAGSAAQMGEAILVNPFDSLEIAQAISNAMEMKIDERKRRMGILQEKVRKFDNIFWSQSFIESWKEQEPQSAISHQELGGKLQEKILKKLLAKKRISLFLDYDGTLTPIVKRPSMAIPSTKVLNILKNLGSIEEINIVLITGRPRKFCDKHFTKLPIHIVAEHGAFLWDGCMQKWQCQLGVEEFGDLKSEVMQLLKMYTRNIPRSHIEEKETCLVWHYREAEEPFADTQAKNLVEFLQQQLRNTSLTVYMGKKSIEVRQIMANKGFAVEHFLQLEKSPIDHGFVTAGDDATDQDMFRVDPKNNISIHIGAPNHFARYFAKSCESFLDFLLNLQMMKESANLQNTIEVSDLRPVVE